MANPGLSPPQPEIQINSDIISRSNGGYGTASNSNGTTKERFFSPTNVTAEGHVNANMLMTGLSKRADSDMMQAKN